MRAGRIGPTPERLALARRAAELREQGLTVIAVAGRLGISRSYADALVHDPTGKLARARKDSYAQPCVDCGETTSGSEGRRYEPRCHACAAIRTGAALTIWTPGRVIAAIQWWNDRYGEPPAMLDWNPTLAAARGYAERAARSRPHIAAGEIPWASVPCRIFGSWNAAIAAAGFEPRQPNGGGGNQLRRRSVRQRAAA